MERLTEYAEQIAHQLPIAPVIIESKEDKFDNVFSAIRGILSEGRFGRIIQDFDIFPTMRTIPRFNYIATILPREWIFDLADAREVHKIFPNTLKFAIDVPTVPEEGIFYTERGAFKEVAPFTSTYYTKKLIGADIANEKGYTGAGVNVAVTDTGLTRRHPATRHMTLDSTMLQIHDENGHGEWCSACIGGAYTEDYRLGRRIKQTIPTEGMAPDANVVGIKCLGYIVGTGSDDGIIKAIELAHNMYRSDIVSMSLGGKIKNRNPENDPYYKVINDLTEQGVVFCVAAGNEGPDPSTVGTPGWISSALTIGAYDPVTGNMADFSSRGPTPDGRIKPDCIAPGVNIHAPICGILDRAGDNTKNNYSPLSGTSMATPHVSGLVACMKQAHRELLDKELTTPEIKKMLQELGHEKNNESGHGLISWQMYEEWISTEYNVEV